jgi:hypothetical protein
MTVEHNIPAAEREPSSEEIKQAAEVLSRLQPGTLPKELFYEFTRLWVTSIIEVVPCRRNSQDQTEVLLLQRPDDDPNWPGMYHTPGTVVRPTDVQDGIETALNRIFSDELNLAQPVPTQLVDIEFHQVSRGPEMAQVYTSDLTGLDIDHGTWCPADQLPDTIVDTQRDFIHTAVSSFQGKGTIV